MELRPTNTRRNAGQLVHRSPVRNQGPEQKCAVFWTSAGVIHECRRMHILALSFVVELFGQDLIALVNRPTR